MPPAAPKPNRGPSAGPENRRALVAAAREVFGAEGFTAPLSAVAKRAGVGQGSLYRHFPDRLSLALAVLDENVAELEAHAELPEATLDSLLDVVIDQALVTTPFVDAILGEGDDPRVAALGTRLDALAHRLHAREVAAHRIAEHVEADDILMAVSMVGATLTHIPESHRADTAARAKAMFRRSFSR
ncbi:TetR/AcrR family transcriptional regulator [Plantibacter flavus]|uniref:TetR family transcriptional regulator n=1 Tax=Plantibacter flavus TaxID=150123 RepID=UPI003F14F833